MSLLEKLKNRGLLHDVSHQAELAKLLDGPPIVFYCGFDPTANSMHVGHMLPLIMMRRLQQAGHKPLALIGTATGMIGDPSFKSDERQLLEQDVVDENAKGLAKQIGLFLDAKGKNAFETVRNHEWLSKISCLGYLRDIGKHFSVNSMMAKDAVKSRLTERDQGISYTEFSYTLLQAYDFFHLNKERKCELQIGGSDQWGNITAGIDLTRRKAGTQVYGFTFPLLMTSSGAKFGKTEKGAVWLSAERTSPYNFYQFWLNAEDADVMGYLRLFTDVDDNELAALTAEATASPEKRAAQQRLAQLLTELVHGKSELAKAEQASRALFGEKLDNLSGAALSEIFADVPSTSVKADIFSKGIQLVELLALCGVAKSKGDARRMLEGGGVYLNNEKVADAAGSIGTGHLIDGSVLVLRSGKRNYHLVRVEGK